MVLCPHCKVDKRQNKAGFTRFGSQRYFCCGCSRTYTPSPKVRGYSAALRQEAVRYSLEGISQRKTARLLRVSPQSVANWLALATKRLEQLQAQGQMPEVPPELLELAEGVMEQDEVFTFCNAKRVGKRKHAEKNAEKNAEKHAEKKTQFTSRVRSPLPPS